MFRLKYLIILIALVSISLVFSNTYAQSQDTVISPLKQLKAGITLYNIKCKQDYVLIIRETNGDPACVKPITIIRLLSYDWMTVEKYQTMHPILQQNQTAIPIL